MSRASGPEDALRPAAPSPAEDTAIRRAWIGLAFQVAARACGNSWVRSQLYTSYRKLGTDGKLSQMMIRSCLFPVTVTSLVESGEETGQMGPMLAKGAELLEMEYRSRVNLIMTVLPVLMLLAVGGLVGFRVYKLLMATYAPIFEM